MAASPTKADLAALVAQQAEALAALQAQVASQGKRERKADQITTARFSYNAGGPTKLTLLVNGRKRIMLSKAEAAAIVKAHEGFDWSDGAPEYVKGA